MENYSILDVLYEHYLNEEYQYNEEYKNAITEFEQTLKYYVKSKEASSELMDLVNNVECAASRLTFKTAFKYVVKLIKECDLL